MLNMMRENLRHLKWVLLIVAVGLVAYLGVYGEAVMSYLFSGSSGEPGGVNASWAARVGGSDISAREFLLEAKRQDDQFRRAFGNQYSQLKSQLRLGTRVIQGLVDQTIIVDEARSLGLEATPGEVAALIQQDPSFRDASGKFIGKDRYTDLIRRNWVGGVASYEARLARGILIRKWMDFVTVPVSVSDADVEQVYRARNERTEIDYVAVPLTDYAGKVSVGDEDVQARYDAHPDDYRRAEGRKIRFVVVDREAQRKQIEVSDEEVRDFYEANRASFSSPEARRARHILFRVEPGASAEDKQSIRELAESVRTRIENGEDFATLARAMSQDPVSAEKGGDLGFFPRGRMVPAFEKAVWETPVGQLAPVVESEFGYHVILVTDSRPEGVRPLEDVADGVRSQLQARKAQERVAAEAARIRGEIATAADLDAVAAKEGLPVEERVLTREDRAVDLAPSPEFVDTVFRLPVNEVGGPLGVGRGMAVVTVTAIEPAGLRPLEEVRDRVREQVRQERAREAAMEAARRALAGNGSLRAAAKSLSKEVQSSGELAPGAKVPGIGASAELQKALFAPDARVGERGVEPTSSGAVIFEITKRDAFDPEAFRAAAPALREEILSQRRDAVVQSLLTELRNSRNVVVNEAMVRRVDEG